MPSTQTSQVCMHALSLTAFSLWFAMLNFLKQTTSRTGSVRAAFPERWSKGRLQRWKTGKLFQRLRLWPAFLWACLLYQKFRWKLSKQTRSNPSTRWTGKLSHLVKKNCSNVIENPASQTRKRFPRFSRNPSYHIQSFYIHVQQRNLI